MDDNITLKTGSYVLNYKDKDGSERRAYGLAPATPAILTVKSQPYVDSVTKVKGKRTVVRVDRYYALETGGTIAPISAYMVVAVPDGSLITAANVTDLVEDICRLVGDDISTANQLQQGVPIFLTGER